MHSSTSRYGNAATLFEGGEATSVNAAGVKEATAGLRAAFDADRTRSYEWRVGQLRALLKMIIEGREELCAALYADLHKSEFEAKVTELVIIERECEHIISHLKGWMKPESTNTSALNWPASSQVQRDPLGIVCVLGAWNYPIHLTMLPVVGAIAGGNCVLIRPASYAPACSHAMARLVHKYLDRDCIRVAEGDRNLTTSILEEKFDLYFYTGSVHVGKIIAKKAAETLTPYVLELGGKSPTIVDKSANLEHAADRIVWAAFLNSGQTCVRPDFGLVHEDVADAFFALMKKKIAAHYGDAQKSEWYGRLINDKAYARVSELLKTGERQMIFGGRTGAGEKFVEPAVFDFGTDLHGFMRHPLMADELFGPLFPVARFRRVEEVVELVRGLPTGKPLALYCYATDASFKDAIRYRTTSGALVINDSTMHLANHELPFGGVGSSGMGNYHGHYSFKTFTHEKAVLAKFPALDESFALKPILSARFPPYTKSKQLLVHIFGQNWASTLLNPPLKCMSRFVRNVILLVLLVRIFGIRVGIHRVA